MDMRDTALTLAIRNRSWRSGEYDEGYPTGQGRQAQSGPRRQKPVDDPDSAQDAEANAGQAATAHEERRHDLVRR